MVKKHRCDRNQLPENNLGAQLNKLSPNIHKALLLPSVCAHLASIFKIICFIIHLDPLNYAESVYVGQEHFCVYSLIKKKLTVAKYWIIA